MTFRERWDSWSRNDRIIACISLPALILAGLFVVAAIIVAAMVNNPKLFLELLFSAWVLMILAAGVFLWCREK